MLIVLRCNLILRFFYGCFRFCAPGKILATMHRLIDLVGRVFANGSEDLGSIPGRVLPKTLKMLLDTALVNTQQYNVRIKSKVEQSRERRSDLPYTSV